MNELTRLQEDFQAYLLADTRKNPRFAARIINDKKVGAEKRLQIYHDAYRLRIIEVLVNAYPKLQALLGEAAFEKAARGYIDQYPSTFRNIRWMGNQMSAYLSQTLPKQPTASEIAAFEWALGLAFDAEDAPVLHIDDLAKIPPETWGDLRFTLHPSVQTLLIHSNAIEIWKALSNEKKPPKPTKTAPQTVLIWRSELDSYFRVMPENESTAITRVCAGATFAELCENIQDATDEKKAVTLAAQFISVWLQDGLIQAIESE